MHIILGTFLQRSFAAVFFLFLLPVFILLFILVKSTSKGPFFFRQKRLGMNSVEFTIYKIRTMITDAEKLQKNYSSLNEIDAPMFKIKNDPRFTLFGRYISLLGLDELPQLINVIKGEMAFIGPRPLPISEACKVKKEYKKRFTVLPGISSPWVVKGGHRMGYRKWMENDIVYVKQKSFTLDLQIVLETLLLFLKVVISLSNKDNKNTSRSLLFK